MLASIRALEDNLTNGGFDQYDFNSSEDAVNYAPAALPAIGAPIMASWTGPIPYSC
jgi:hypothetical protein